MDTRDFKAGKLRKQYDFSNFIPEPVNKEWVITQPKLVALHSEADRKLGELNASGKWIPDLDIFISMHIAKEAQKSSRIEGTQTTMEEAMTAGAEIDPDRRDDWQEVRNYIAAMDAAMKGLEKLPLSNRLLKQTHDILLSGVRGKHKNPGEWRKSQNWLGPSLKTAVYVPPSHEDIPELMSDLEKFLNNQSISVAPLVRIALAHYQFESIHPFLDGNGRLGRLLITLYLVSERILEKPTLYLSDYFERHRGEYYDHLTRVREKNDLEGWLRFFFVGVIETAQSSIQTFENIVRLREHVNQTLPKLGKRAENGGILAKYLFAKPVITSGEIETACGFSTSTANRLIADFQSLGLLRELTGFHRNRRFSFAEYLGLFQS